MEISRVEIGCRIQSLRKNRNYSREKFGELVGISSKFLYEIENGKKGFSAFVLCNIAQACGVSCDYIMYGHQKSDDEFNKIIGIIDANDINKIETIMNYILKIKSGR